MSTVDQRIIECNSLKVLQDSTVITPGNFNGRSLIVATSPVDPNWTDSPDFVLKDSGIYIGLDHFEAHTHSLGTPEGKRVHAETDIFRRLIEAVNQGNTNGAGMIIGEMFGTNLGNLVDPGILDEYAKGIIYSITVHLKKLSRYRENLRNGFNITDNCIKMGFLIDWKLNPITVYTLDPRDLITFIWGTLKGVLESLMNCPDCQELSYLFINMYISTISETGKMHEISETWGFDLEDMRIKALSNSK